MKYENVSTPSGRDKDKESSGVANNQGNNRRSRRVSAIASECKRSLFVVHRQRMAHWVPRKANCATTQRNFSKGPGRLYNSFKIRSFRQERKPIGGRLKRSDAILGKRNSKWKSPSTYQANLAAYCADRSCLDPPA